MEKEEKEAEKKNKFWENVNYIINYNQGDIKEKRRIRKLIKIGNIRPKGRPKKEEKPKEEPKIEDLYNILLNN